MNKVLLIGRIVKKPELKKTLEKEIPYIRFTIAVNREVTKEDRDNNADFIQVSIWGRKAEDLADYLTKGRLVNVIGRIRSGRYEREDGSKRYYTEIFGEHISFLDIRDLVNKESNETIA